MLMKRLVNLVQLAIVGAILYPVYYVWDTQRIENFCEQILPGMKVKALNALAEESGIDLNASETLRGMGQWMTSIESSASLDRYACVIIGTVDSVVSANIIDE